jgi:hypothetical protein
MTHNEAQRLADEILGEVARRTDLPGTGAPIDAVVDALLRLEADMLKRAAEVSVRPSKGSAGWADGVTDIRKALRLRAAKAREAAKEGATMTREDALKCGALVIHEPGPQPDGSGWYCRYEVFPRQMPPGKTNFEVDGIVFNLTPILHNPNIVSCRIYHTIKAPTTIVVNDPGGPLA